jgi:hypothetical protein
MSKPKTASILDCNTCINSGFYWSTVNNNCNAIMHNVNDVSSSNGIGCPVQSTVIGLGLPLSDSTLTDLVGDQDIVEQETQLIKSIQILQNMEKDLYNQLTNGIKNGALTTAEQDTIMQNIAEVTALRINLYRNLMTMVNSYQQTIQSASNIIKDNLIAINIVDKELEESALKLKKINDDNTTKMRMVEINRYYKDKYANHAVFMKYFILFTTLILIVYFIHIKGYINDSIYYVLIFIIIFFMLYKMSPLFYRMIFRSNMDYQEYSFPIGNLLTGNVNSGTSTISASINNPWLNNTITSINSCINDLSGSTSSSTTTGSTTTGSSTTS